MVHDPTVPILFGASISEETVVLPLFSSSYFSIGTIFGGQTIYRTVTRAPSADSRGRGAEKSVTIVREEPLCRKEQTPQSSTPTARVSGLGSLDCGGFSGWPRQDLWAVD